MSALRLEVETHIVTASATAVQNLTKCVSAAGRQDRRARRDSLASAEAVLTETEKELGVAVADIGAGTIDLALFHEGSPFHTRVLPVGGNNVTNDVAIGLKTSLQVAEELKIRHGTCDLRASTTTRRSASRCSARRPAERSAGSRSARSSRRACARRSSCCATRCARRASGMLPAGRHPDRRRGAAGRRRRSSAATSSRCRSASPSPSGIGGLVDTLLTPSTATGIGLLEWGAAARRRRADALRVDPGRGGLGRIRDALRSIFP